MTQCPRRSQSALELGQIGFLSCLFALCQGTQDLFMLVGQMTCCGTRIEIFIERINRLLDVLLPQLFIRSRLLAKRPISTPITAAR